MATGAVPNCVQPYVLMHSVMENIGADIEGGDDERATRVKSGYSRTPQSAHCVHLPQVEEYVAGRPAEGVLYQLPAAAERSVGKHHALGSPVEPEVSKRMTASSPGKMSRKGKGVPGPSSHSEKVG